jgi:hypothetical protein
MGFHGPRRGELYFTLFHTNICLSVSPASVSFLHCLFLTLKMGALRFSEEFSALHITRRYNTKYRSLLDNTVCLYTGCVRSAVVDRDLSASIRSDDGWQVTCAGCLRM